MPRLPSAGAEQALLLVTKDNVFENGVWQKNWPVRASA